MADKIEVWQGDTVPVAYECREPDPDDPHNTEGILVEPASATARLYDRSEGEFMDLGGVGDITADATVDGAVIRYTVPSAFTQTPGDYVLYITAQFSDGNTLTEERRIKVLEYR
jgi:hypothetical protein